MMTWKTRLLHFERMWARGAFPASTQDPWISIDFYRDASGDAVGGMYLLHRSCTAAGLGVWVPVKRALIQF